MEIEADEVDGMKIREIREKYDRDEISINVLQWTSPRSGELLQGGTETKSQLLERTNYEGGRYQSYSKSELLWELPLDQKIRMLVTSGRNENGTKELTVGNLRIDWAEATDAEYEADKILERYPELLEGEKVKFYDLTRTERTFVKRDQRFEVIGDPSDTQYIKYKGEI